MPSTSTPHLSATDPLAQGHEPADPAGEQAVSADLEWEDPITGERLGIRLRAGAGLLGRLLQGGFEEAQSAPGGAISPGPGVAA